MADAVPLFSFDNKILTPVSDEVLLRQNDKGEWNVIDKNATKTKIFVTLFQMFVILLVLITCILNISLQNGNSEMWVSFLGLAFGAVLPGPKAKRLSSNSLLKAPLSGVSSPNVNSSTDSFKESSNTSDIDASV